MSEQLTTMERQLNGLPVDIKDWSEDELMDSYLFLENLPLNELNAAAMLEISHELDERKNRS